MATTKNDPKNDRCTLNGKVIDHIIVVMFENRGFDHFMGWLYEGPDKQLNHVPALASAPKSQAGLREFEGLEGLEPSIRDDKDGKAYSLRKGARASNVPTVNPHEDFIHIFEQLYNQGRAEMATKASREKLIRKDGKYQTPSMDGWVNNYRSALADHGEIKSPTPAQLSEILDMYTPAQLPVLSGLARHYAISDQWFCSVPSQTNTNRAFYLAGTARGLVTNSFLEYYPKTAAFKPGEKKTHTDALPKGTRTLFDVLDENKVTWAYYWHSPWPPTNADNQYARTMFSMYDKKYDARFKKFAEFVTQVTKGTLPSVCIIEPEWGGGGSWTRPGYLSLPRGVGNEFHPVEDTVVGEFFVKHLYDLVSRSPAWERTLLVITFDENGGTYDHFPPPTSDSDGLVHRPSPDPAVNGLPELPDVPKGPVAELPVRADFLPGGAMLPDAVRELDRTTHTQFGFEYDMFGLRVPTMFISPYIKPRTVLRSPTEVPFDHTSIIATILKWQRIDPAQARLGDRVANAPTFDGVLEGIDAAGAARPREDPRLGIRGYGRPDQSQTPLKYGDEVRLRYMGNPWPFDPSAAYRGKPYLGGPEWALDNYWYPYLVASSTDPNAFKFKLVGGSGSNGKPVPNGASVEIAIAHSSTAKSVGYKLAVPDKLPLSVADTVWLTTETGDHTHWRIWLLDDRVDGTHVYPGDKVLLFSERYQPDKVSTGMTGYDPYMRLAPEATASPRYLKFRAGEWDVWQVEK